MCDRVSDVLWVLARVMEQLPPSGEGKTKDTARKAQLWGMHQRVERLMQLSCKVRMATR